MTKEPELAATPQILLQDTTQPAVLTLAGALDVSCAAELRARAIDALAVDSDVRVEFGEVFRIDASTVTVLISLRNSLADLGRGLRLSPASPEVQSYLEMLGASALFDWEASPNA